jgi:hypothetical protein
MRYLLAVMLALAPASVRAAPSCGSAPECIARLGLPHLNWEAAAVLGAIAAPAVLATAVLTAAGENAKEKALPEGVVVTTDENGEPRASLELVPTTRDRYYNENPPEPQKPSGAFRFNDTATNVALAVGGAALLTGIIVGIVKGNH